MSGLEVLIIVGSGISALSGAFSNFIHWRKARKNRRDIKTIKEHTKPKIIISSSGNLTPLPTPINGDEIDTGPSVEMSDINPRFVKQELYYDRDSGNYFETIPTNSGHPY